MFESLTTKLHHVFSRLTGTDKLSEENISDAVREVRMALLEADVNYGVTKTFVQRVKEKALGAQVVGQVSPSNFFVKLIHDELKNLMGGEEPRITLPGKPAIVLLCGLQGSGKTTACVKLARYFSKHHGKERPLLVACDLQRPAAIEQLKILGASINVPVFSLEGVQDPIKVAKRALEEAKLQGYDLIIFDSAGRLHVDEALMGELKSLKAAVQPQMTLFVANATTGQDAVKSAAAVNEAVEITGTILTMLDGDTRAGAAISVREVTGKPLLFEGTGEKIEDLQLFNPTSMADRILGMGDTINLVKKAQETISEDEARRLEKKLRKATFTFGDYLTQFERLEKMGPLRGLLKMLPLPVDIGKLDGVESNVGKLKAIIRSMTTIERDGDVELSMSRRRRIAKGSGTSLDDVNRFVKSFAQTKRLLRDTRKRKQLGKMFGGQL